MSITTPEQFHSEHSEFGVQISEEEKLNGFEFGYQEFHKNLPQNGIDYIAARGFKVIKGLPKFPQTLNRRHIVLSTNSNPIYYYGKDISLCARNVRLKCKNMEVILGVIENAILSAKYNDNKHPKIYYANPEGQSIFLFMNGEEFEPVSHNLAKRYPISFAK